MERKAVIKIGPGYSGNSMAERVANYLPSNYKVTDASNTGVTITGEDSGGWTLDGYVLPRLASGLIFGEEVGA
jgi:hypothetical protein